MKIKLAIATLLIAGFQTINAQESTLQPTAPVAKKEAVKNTDTDETPMLAPMESANDVVAPDKNKIITTKKTAVKAKKKTKKKLRTSLKK